jgi:hypothetical protein
VRPLLPLREGCARQELLVDVRLPLRLPATVARVEVMLGTLLELRVDGAVAALLVRAGGLVGAACVGRGGRTG